MNKENLIVILGGVIFLAIGLVITFNITEKKEININTTQIKNSSKENKMEEKNNTEVTFESSEIQIDNNSTNVSSNNPNKEITSNIDTTKVIDNNSNNAIVKKEEKEEPSEINYSNNDSVVISSLENTLDKVKNTTTDSKFIDSAKGIFISLVDFIFYDGEINGITFDELTASGKEKVLNLANKIDTAIEEKVPGYKETIRDKATAAFTKASELIKKGANNINDFAKEKLGEEYYNDIIAAKDELVYYTKNAINFIGDIGGNLFNSAKDKLNNWYQNFKNNN